MLVLGVDMKSEPESADLAQARSRFGDVADRNHAVELHENPTNSVCGRPD